MSSRSGIERLTGPSTEAGGAARLKVLWIDDERARSLHPQRRQLARLVGEYFDIYTAAVPEQVAAGIAATVDGVHASWVGARYDLSTFPFDVYLADWRLTDAGDNETGQDSVTHLAEAAGLATAVLAACHYPSHPSVVIPYSAYWDRLRAYGELYRILSPPGVLVAWKEGAEFKSRQHTELIREISRLYRRALRRALMHGAIHLAFSSAAEAQHALQSGAAARSWLDGQNTLTLITPWGRREVLLKALWLDTLEARRFEIPLRDHLLSLCREEAPADHELARLVPPAEGDRDATAAELEGLDEDDLRLWLLRRWLEPIPTLREEVLQASADARAYLIESFSEECERRYELRDEIQQAMDDGRDPLGVPKIAAELQRLNIQAADSAALESATAPGHLTGQALIDSQEEASDSTKRLSVLILILLAESHRALLRNGEESDWLALVKAYLEQIGHDAARNAEHDPDAVVKRLARTLEPLRPEDLQRLLYPRPAEIWFEYMIVRNKRFGQRYNRLDPPLFLHDLIKRRAWPEALRATVPPPPATASRSWPGVPFGYRLEEDGATSRLVSDPDFSQQVPSIFEAFLKTLSFRGVLNQLLRNEPTAGAASLAEPWTKEKVRAILEDSRYVGLVEAGREHYQGPHEPLVDPGLFHRVRLRIGYPLPEEIRILRGYAREIELNPESWPWWLREPMPT